MTLGEPPYAPAPPPPRSYLAIGLAVGAVVGLALGLLVARNGAPSQAETAQAPTTVTVTAEPEKQIIEPPATVTVTAEPAQDADAAPSTTGSDGGEQQVRLTDAIGPVGDLATRTADDPFALGSAQAPVTMVMFSDYRCPFCALFSQQTEQRLVDTYVADGRLRIEWRDFPIFGEESIRAAIAGRAAAKQGLFWQYNKALYAAAPGSGHPELPVEELIGFAEQVGVPDIDAFRNDLADAELRAAVETDRDLGNSLGVPATPSFVINGYPVRGAQPFDEFAKVIDALLALQE